MRFPAEFEALFGQLLTMGIHLFTFESVLAIAIAFSEVEGFFVSVYFRSALFLAGAQVGASREISNTLERSQAGRAVVSGGGEVASGGEDCLVRFCRERDPWRRERRY